jgi:hypothetical protein
MKKTTRLQLAAQRQIQRKIMRIATNSNRHERIRGAEGRARGCRFLPPRSRARAALVHQAGRPRGLLSLVQQTGADTLRGATKIAKVIGV